MIDFCHQKIGGIPAALVPFHVQLRKALRLSVNNLKHRYGMLQDCQGKTVMSQGCYERELAISTPVPCLRRAAGVLEPHSITPCLSCVRVRGTVKGRLTAELITYAKD